MPNSIVSVEIMRDVTRQRFGTTIVQNDIKPTAQALSRSIPALLLEFDTDNLTKTELNTLTAKIRAEFSADWSDMWNDITPQLLEVAMIEGEQVTELYNKFAPETFIAPAEASIATATNTAIMTLTGSKVESGTWQQFVNQNVDSTSKLVASTVRNGFNSNLTLNEIVQQLRGKYNRRTKQYVGGVINGTSTSRAEALARTGLNHYSSVARDRFADANSDIIESRITFVTLDNRTTTICLGRNGIEYKLGEPYPPLPYHYNCRTIYVFKTKGFDPRDVDRPSVGGKKGSEAEAEFNKRKDRQDATRDNRAEKRAEGEATPETKSKVTYRGRKDSDTFNVKLVDGNMSSDEWMRSQPTWFQESSLGPTRAKLFSDGDMSIDSFTTMTGRPLTLKELRASNPISFDKAGI